MTIEKKLRIIGNPDAVESVEALLKGISPNVETSLALSSAAALIGRGQMVFAYQLQEDGVHESWAQSMRGIKYG